MNQFENNLKIIEEEMAKLYEHTDKIITKQGKTLVDVQFNITEKEVDNILIERIIDLLNKFDKKYSEEDLSNLVNETKKNAVRKINQYREENNIKNFEENDIDIQK